MDAGVGRAARSRWLRRGLLAVVALGVAAAGLVEAQQPSASPGDASAPTPVIQPPAPAAAPTDGASPTAPGLRPATDATPPDDAESAAKPTKSASSAAPPVDKPPEPPKPLRSPAAILQGLDKVTAETIRFEAPIGKRIRYKNLVFTVKACETTGIDDPQPQAAAYLLVESQPRAVPGHEPPPAKQVYKGWMFSTAPGLHPFEHPVYDAWLIACSASAPPA